MNHNRTRAFHMSAAEIVQLLDADDSGDENDDVMDKEDPTFLEEGSDNNRDEVIIEGQNVITESSEKCSESSCSLHPPNKKQKIGYSEVNFQ